MFVGTTIKWSVLEKISKVELADNSLPVSRRLLDQLHSHVRDVDAVQARAGNAVMFDVRELRLEQDQQTRDEECRRVFRASAQKEVAALRVVRLLLLRSQELIPPVAAYASSKTSAWIAEEETLRVLRQLALNHYGSDEIEPIARSYLEHKASMSAGMPLLDYDNFSLPNGLPGLVAYRGYLAARKKRLAAQVALMVPAHQDPELLGVVDEQVSVREALAKVWIR